MQNMSSHLKMGTIYKSCPTYRDEITCAETLKVKRNHYNWRNYNPIEALKRRHDLEHVKDEKVRALVLIAAAEISKRVSEWQRKVIEDPEKWFRDLINLVKKNLPMTWMKDEIKRFQVPDYPQVTFEAHAFELEFISTAKLYIILCKGDRLGEHYVMFDLLFFSFP